MREVRRSRGHAFAKGTFSNLHTQFRSYFAFCVYFRRVPLPASLHTICGYAQFLSRSLIPSSIRNYLSGVKMLHIFLGFEYRFTDNFHLQLVLRGIARMNPHVPRRARPITPDVLLAFREGMDHDNSLHCTVYACGLMLFLTLARLGSVLPASTSSATSEFLGRDCINFSTEGLLVTFLRTKTIQFGRRRLHVPLLRLGSHLCPVGAFTRALQLVGPSSYVPAFVFTEGSSIRWLTKSIFVDTFRGIMKAQGDEDYMSYTGHSFRRGGASWAFRAGVPGELIQVCGDWTSDAYKVYLEFSMQNKLDLATLFCRSLPR